MSRGKDLLDTISKVLLVVVFAVMIIGILIPRGEGMPLMFGGVALFFLFPFIESGLILYHKWLYRNIVIGEGYLDEEPDLWEKFKIRIIKVIPFKELPKTLHESYKANIKEYYEDQLKDEKLILVDKRFEIDEESLNIRKLKKIDFEAFLALEDKKKKKASEEYLNEEEEEK